MSNANVHAAFLTEAARVMPKWESYGLLEGIKNEDIRRQVAVLCENQHLANLKVLRENATDTSDIASFQKISIPLIRRVFPQLIANKLVGVQPLLGPVGLVYYQRLRYSSNKGATRGASNNGGFPGDDANSLGQTAAGDVNLDVYYTSQFVSNETSSTDNGADVTSEFVLEHAPIFAGTTIGTIYDGAVAVQTFVVSEAGTFTFTDIGAPVTKVTGATLNLTTGALVLTWNAAPGDNNVIVSYDYNMECNPDMPEINFVMENQAIQAKTRKLKAVWSPEASQDLRSQHNLDLDAELAGSLATEINLEIDREVLGDLRNNAGTVSTWDYNTSLGDTIKEKYESLFVKLVEVGSVIHRKTMRGSANWVVCAPEVAAVFETATAGFAPAPSDTFTSSMGVQYVGTVNGKWKMYKDPHMPRNQVLMGLKGDTAMDTGYFYCPYVPLTQTPVVVHPETFCYSRGLLTRYGKVLLRDGAKYYARINLANLNVG